MRIFGLEVSRAKDAVAPITGADFYGAGGGGWRPFIREPYSGAWQQNQEISVESALASHTVYACVTLIAGDIGKLRPKLVALDSNGIWSEASSPAFSPVLRRPNNYQTHIQFKEWWITQKLIRGNAYGLLERDQRGVVVAIHILNAHSVTPLVTPAGDVYYQLSQDNLAGLTGASVTVPASEIVHDRMNCLFHPLVGVSPMFACGLAAQQSRNILQNSSQFFRNGSNPSGILTAPAQISDVTAKRLKDEWSTGFTGQNSGRVAVLGDGLTFEAMRMTAVESQLLEQLNATAAIVCSDFHVPGFMVGVGAEPAFANGETRTQHYYSQCLQTLIESFEECMDWGMGLDTPKQGVQYGVELDLDGLIRMDNSSLISSLKVAVDGTIMTPDEARKRVNLPPMAGGNMLWKQQQEFSLEALAKRDAKADPFAAGASASPAVTPAAAPAVAPPTTAVDDAPASAKDFLESLTKDFREAMNA